jgi:two-component system response regulator CpxR
VHAAGQRCYKDQVAVLFIDDDVGLCALMTEFLSAQGYAVTSAHDGPSGLARALAEPHEIVILDVMLPRLDGFELLRQLRRRSDVPVIMLTARGGSTDRLEGFDAGADDYLMKPFVPGELLARIRAVLRRTQGEQRPAGRDVRVGLICLNNVSRRVWSDRGEIELTSIEFDLLDLLMRAAGRVVSRDEISAAIFQRDASPFDRSIDVHVSHLRRKLAPYGDPLLRTVRGVGYLFSPTDQA